MPRQPKQRKHVVVVGGGVGGLTVAHELMEKGYDVTILEADARCGGKAVCERDGPLFRDHSIKNFSAYYYCLLEQLKRIPYNPTLEEMDAARAAAKAAGERYVQPTRVFDNLKGTNHVNLTLPDNSQYELVSTMGQSPSAILRSLGELRDRLESFGVPKQDFDSFIWKHARMLFVCKQRKLKTVDKMSYQEYLGFDVDKHPATKLISQLVELTAAANIQGSAMVAAEQALRQFGRVINPHNMKTTTVSLNGPIDRTFIEPWVDFLTRERKPNSRKGKVTIRTNTRVSAVLVDQERARARGVRLQDGSEVVGDYTVLATSFAHLKTLVTESNLREQVPVPELDSTLGEKWGHMCHYSLSALPEGVQANTLYIVLGSPWAVIYVYYTRDFWPGFPEYFADAPVQLWVTTSCAVREGTNGKLYTQCLEDEFKDELLRQIYFRDEDRHLITSSVVGRGLSWWNKKTQKRTPAHADGSDAGPPRPGDRVIAIDDEWDIVSDTTLYAPEVGMPPTLPTTNLTDLYIAGEVAKTHQLVSTMEKANEAGKRVAHLICRRDGKSYDESRYVYHLPFRWVRRMDAFFYRLFCGACGCCCC